MSAHSIAMPRRLSTPCRPSFFGGGGLPDEILIFRDTLVRDFGDDPNRLRMHVVQTVRHEVGHHLGFNEAGVRKLGL
jgi:predicted Zn-dependent protease with MMP-like domain